MDWEKAGGDWRKIEKEDGCWRQLVSTIQAHQCDLSLNARWESAICRFHISRDKGVLLTACMGMLWCRHLNPEIVGEMKKLALEAIRGYEDEENLKNFLPMKIQQLTV